MKQPPPIKDSVSEIRSFRRRALVAMVFAGLLMVVLIGRLVYLQIMGHEHYAQLAKNNHIKIASLPPTRGLIYDRQGRILAENLPIYTLEITREDVEDLDDTLARLQVLLSIPEDTISAFRKQSKRERWFAGIPLLTRMTPTQVARFAVRRPYFPGVEIKARLARYYPYQELTSHVVGYVGRINEKELKSLPVTEYRGTQFVGKVAIVQVY